VEFAQTIKLQLAEIYSRKKDLASMFAILQKMKSRLALASSSQRLEWNRLTAAYYEQSGQYGFALKYLKNYSTLNDSIATEQKLLTAADVVRQLKDKDQQMQIAVLKKDKEVALASRNVAIVLSLMAMAILYLIYNNYRRNKKHLQLSEALNKEINDQKAAREEEAKLRHQLITEAVIRAQENERSLIGLELHDNINQVLTTVKLHNEMVLDGVAEPQSILPRSINYLQNCINEIRSLSKRLSAPTLGKISLQESINDLIESINETSKVKITCQMSGLAEPVLRQELHLGVYRILQEQLHNVIKHSEASEVSVQLEHKQETIQLVIADNGKGFAVSETKNGIGLVNMQTRAESLNGTFELESHPGRGCKIKVILPCPQ
ncbi:MAG: sensor histidine kinase, partial [Flavisolibacter sp.]|nr:sensor histidine kinase [Flavisolibacter sp.]